MKKRVLSVWLALCMACGLASAAWAAGEPATPETARAAQTQLQEESSVSATSETAATPEPVATPDGMAEPDINSDSGETSENMSQSATLQAYRTPSILPRAAALRTGEETADTGSLILDKWVEDGDDDTFKLVLETYATGSDGTVTTEPVPLDIVLVLDESGSMGDVLIEGCDNEEQDVHVRAEEHLLASNSTFPNEDRSQELFVGHKVFADDIDTSKTYRVVYPEAASIADATRKIYYCTECGGWFSTTNHADHDKIAKWIPFSKGQENKAPTGEHTTEDWYYCVQFYEECGQTGRDILQQALSQFLNDLSKNSVINGETIPNRVAIVGYGQGAFYIQEDGERVQVYQDFGDAPAGAPVDGSDSLAKSAWCNVADLNQTNIQQWVNGVLANGSTPTHLGIQAAELAFDNAPATDDNRAKVMILFTDGAPGANYVNFGPDALDGKPDWVTPAIESAKRMKDDNVTIYSVGLFPNANGNDAENISYDVTLNGQGTEGFFENANCFLHLVSSNYPEATGVDENQRGSLSGEYEEGTKSYYLGTNDAEELNEIFSRISEEITPGSTTVQLDESAVTKDTIADNFNIIEGNNTVRAWTESYQGKNVDGEMQWSVDSGSESNNEDSPLQVSVSGDTVYVTGFDFAENFVHMLGETPMGKKLVIEILIEPTADTPGGTKLPTNVRSSAGVYENDEASTAVKYFPMPYVDLPTTVTVKKVVEGPDTNDQFKFSVSGTQAETDEEKDYICVDDTTPGESNYLQLQEEGFTNSTFTLGNEETYQLTGIIGGSELTISETEAGDYTPVVTVGNSTVPLHPDEDGNYTVNVTPGMIITFTNTPNTGNLTLLKKIVNGSTTTVTEISKPQVPGTGDEMVDATYSFVITAKDDLAEKVVANTDGYVISGSTDKVKFTESGEKATATVPVTPGTTGVTIEDLPTGPYTITEESPAAEVTSGDTTYYYVGNDAENGETGIVEKDKTDSVTITNTYKPYYTVTITKDVTGEMGDTTKAFDFTTSVTRDNETANITSATTTVSGETINSELHPNKALKVENQASYTTGGYTLADKESIAISKLKEGDELFITEPNATGQGYTVTWTNADNGKVTVNGDMQVTVTNNRKIVAPTGLESNHTAPYTLIVTAAGLAGLALIGSVAARRVRRRREE